MKFFLTLLLGLLCFSSALVPGRAAPADYFQITVVDADTGRGVPLVELKTTNAITFYTDSNGIVAVNDPDLLGHSVWFGVKSHGYEYPADGFGNRGKALDVKAGGQAKITLKRVNIAERLYRITGAGIYADSVKVGAKVPIQNPLMDGLVVGQDTVMATPYNGKLYWFYGDTSKPSYPLGQFATSGATSPLPSAGGLDPSVGINLTYWVDKEGFSRPMLPLPGFGGPVWVGGAFTLTGADKQEHLYTHYTHLDGSGKAAEQGLAQFDDAAALFKPVHPFALDTPLYVDGQPFFASSAGQQYLYCQSKTSLAMPFVRVLADLKHVLDNATYQGYTCLPTGGKFDGGSTKLDRTVAGKLVYAWKTNTPVLSYDDQQTLVDKGLLKPDEVLAPLRDIDTDAPVHSHGGSVHWNPYLKRWVMISGQAGGTSSYLGEMWFAEADTPVGPWVYARKIITHDKYTFYNPTQHPFFDQDGGRVIYLEGTYTDTYSGTTMQTPRYNYNQIMYRLTLSDPRLSLPAPVYALKNGLYAQREQIAAGHLWPAVQSVPFFAVPTGRAHDGLVALYSAGGKLTLDKPAASSEPLCWVLPLTPAASEKPAPSIITLNTASGTPLCRVWRNPSSVLTLDPDAEAAP